MISQDTIQQILSRIDILDIVGSYVSLKKRGANYLGLCPFHNEKSPSFTVSPAKEIYKCFGCGKSGNSISFLMELEKYSYVEALKWLANKYDVQVEEFSTSPEQKQQQLTADSLYIINNFAQKFFIESLNKTEEGQDIGLAYLKERGFTNEIIEKFQIGYNPEGRDTFANLAIESKYNVELLQKTGLVSFRDEKLTDNYRGRIVFPIHSPVGKIIGFGARILKTNDRVPKYINTPENEIYVKSKVLYGSYFARQAIGKNDECLLVEGYTDVVSMHQAGIENVVASGGTSLTPDQLRLVKKYTNNLTIIYDGDSAGIKAALRGMDLAFEAGLNVKLVLVPDNEDPDSYVKKYGGDAFKDFIEANRKDFIIFQLEVSIKDASNDPAKKAVLVNQIAETISKIDKAEDFTKQQHYIRQCSELLNIEETGLHNLVNKFIRVKLDKADQQSQLRNKQPDGQNKDPEAYEYTDVDLLVSRDELQERAIVRSLLEFGLKKWDETNLVAHYIFSELDNDLLDALISNPQLINIVNIYREDLYNGVEPDAKKLLYNENQEISNTVVQIMSSSDEVSPNWNERYERKLKSRDDLYKEEVTSVICYLKLRKIKSMIAQNQKDLEKSTDPDDQLIIMKVHQHLKQIEISLTKEAGTVIFK